LINQTTGSQNGIYTAVVTSGGAGSATLHNANNAVSSATVTGTPTQTGNGLSIYFTGGANSNTNWVLHVGTQSNSFPGTSANFNPPMNTSIVVDGVTYVTSTSVYGAATGTVDITAGGSATMSSFTRATDADGSSSGPVKEGMYFFCEEGSTYANAGFLLTTQDPITVGTTSLTFIQFSRAEQIQAGTGLSKSGMTLSIANTGVSAGTYVGLTINAQGQVTSATDLNSLSDYGITDALKKQAFTITGDGSTTDFDLTHNLMTRDVRVAVRAAASPYDFPEVLVQEAGSDGTNKVRVSFATAPANGVAYRAMVDG
jgi:hypothetical protein